jgi:hypothetical protein
LVVRVCLAIALMLVSTRFADACPPPDRTYVVVPGGMLGNDEPTEMPANPSVYVHVGRESPPGMPTFTRPDGSVVPSRRVELISIGWEEAWRVDLAVEAGDVIVKVPIETVLVRLPGATLVDRPWDLDVRAPGERILGTLHVTSSFAPSEVAIERDDDVLRVDSNASLYRLERFDDDTRTLDAWGVVSPSNAPYRVVAIYADRREQVIYVHWPTSGSQTRMLWLVALACSAWIGSRFARGLSASSA